MNNKIKIRLFIIDDLREKINFKSIKKHLKGIFSVDPNLGKIDSNYQLSM